MKPHKMAKKLLSHFDKHNAGIMLPAWEVIEDAGGLDRIIYDVALKKGAKEDTVFDRAKHVQTALQLPLLHPFWDGKAIRLAVSNNPTLDNSLQRMIKNRFAHVKDMWLSIPLGYDMTGAMIFVDLAKLPHAKYGGGTLSGKTVALQCMVAYLVMTQPVSRVNIVIIDTGANGLDCFGPVPHLSYHEIIKDEETAFLVIKSLFEELGARKSLTPDELRALPAIVIVIDEYVTLIQNIRDDLRKKLVSYIEQLLQKGRHRKIHPALATQEPNKEDMIISQNNLKGRMAFACVDQYASKAMLGIGGAEKLRGKGELLYKSPDYPKPTYFKGAYVTTVELDRLIAHVVSKPHDCNNKFIIPPADLSQLNRPAIPGLTIIADIPDDDVPMMHVSQELAEITLWALSQRNVSSLQIQKQFRMGRPRADTIVDELYRMEIIEEKFANQPRKVIPACIEDLTSDVIDFLAYHGYTGEHIQKAFDDKRLVADDGESDSKHPKRVIPNRPPKVSAMCELDSLIGLEAVKVKVKEIAVYLESKGKKTPTSVTICALGETQVLGKLPLLVLLLVYSTKQVLSKRICW